MPSFKPKSNKKIKFNKQKAVTLDTKHTEIINEFDKDENDKIPELKYDRSLLKKQLNNENLTIEQRLDIEDQIEQINATIKETKLKKKEYYLDNSKYIFEYFENKKNISTGANVNTTNSKTNLINSFFKIKKNEEDDLHLKSEIEYNNIVQKYLSNIDDSFLDINTFVSQIDICKFCFKGELVPVEDEGILVCNACSRSIPYLIENEKPSYKEPPKEVCFYAYKRINHFKEILAQFQAKETTQIPEEVLENIKHQLNKERITLAKLTNSKAKEILKKLGYNKYYENAQYNHLHPLLFDVANDALLHPHLSYTIRTVLSLYAH